MSTKISQIVECLKAAKSILFITGAGVSADSGLPTYRGIGGLYNVDDTEEGYPIEVLLSGEMLRQRPELTWKYLAEIALACRGKAPNRGHEIIAEVEDEFDRVCVLTQNVDGFHREAGSHNVIDIHGDLHDLMCTSCPKRQRVNADDFDSIEIPPRCAECNHVVRPDVVLFGELLPPQKVSNLRTELDAGFDLVFSIGTTSVFPYIAEPVVRAAQAGKPTIEINPGKSEISDLVDIALSMKASEALQKIWTTYQQQAM